MRIVHTRSSEETVALGASFAASLAPGAVVGLVGDLGSGKTQFVVGVCRGLGLDARVSSPTFTLINEYPAPFGTVVHADLYRISTRRELAELGIEEYFNDRCLCLIEWAERMRGDLPGDAHLVSIAAGVDAAERVFTFDRVGEVAA
jgi:tRNA threonylcarbamoyladenosine biosynthesis protein TsaE